MGKRIAPNKKLEDAMADALAAVERPETSATPEKVAAPAADAANRPEHGDENHELRAEAPQGEAPAPEAAQPSQADELRDQLLRLAADFENYRKRAQREVQDARRFGSERLLADLLVVIDNLERAIAHAGTEPNPVIDGVRMVVKQFVDTLGNYGVKSFPSQGKLFDPERHEAVGQAPGGELPPGTVLEEITRGYFLHDRLLRPAQVIVVAASQADEGGAGATA